MLTNRLISRGKLYAVVLGVLAVSAIRCGGDRAAESESQIQAISSWEDCVSLDWTTAAVRNIGGRWKIVEGPGGAHMAFDFGANRAEADRTLNIIRTYRVKHSCFVGRPDPSFKYILGAGGNGFGGNMIAGEDCVTFNPQTVAVRHFPAQNTYKLVDGNHWIVDFGNRPSEAYLALRIVRKYAFSRQCFVGRPDPSFIYWKM